MPTEQMQDVFTKKFEHTEKFKPQRESDKKTLKKVDRL